ncbi:MAG: VanZ family protein [Gammaproteobacteria bacterium]|nr:VanZ family protein [Gammaproteobacteria bacterium]
MTNKEIQTPYQLHWWRFWFFIGCLWVGTVTLMSLIALQGDWGYTHSDKFLHMVAYGTSMGWFMQLYPRHRHRFLLALLFAGQGIGIEFLQGLTSYRSFDYWDMLANTLGVGLAWLLGFGFLSRLLLYFEAWLRGQRQALPQILKQSRIGGAAERVELQLSIKWHRLWFWLGFLLMLPALLLICDDLRDATSLHFLGRNSYRFLLFSVFTLGFMQLYPSLWPRLGLLLLFLLLALAVELYYQHYINGFFHLKHGVMSGSGVILGFVVGFTPFGYLPWFLTLRRQIQTSG